MKKSLYILAPNDRFNYGDMLFPYIVEYYFRSFFDKIIYCSISKSDLSAKGGVKTEAFDVLYNPESNCSNYLIVAGGECLSAEWGIILSYIDSRVDKIKKIIEHIHYKRLERFLLNEVAKHYYKFKTRFPFSIGKIELKNFDGVYYNSLGGIDLVHKKEVLNSQICHKIFNSVDYISVRDEQTSNGLKRMNIKHFVCADSAISMSKVFSEFFLLGRRSEDVKEKIFPKYIFFQISLRCLKNNEKEYAKIIETVHRKTGLKICLCPIGTALGHEDHIALSKIALHLPNDIFIYIKEPNIWDIMWLIKHSSIYIGTSLHGMITAMSFEVPFVGHNVFKLKKYIDYWIEDEKSTFSSDFNNLEKTITERLKNKNISSPKKQMETVQKSFDLMVKLINKNVME